MTIPTLISETTQTISPHHRLADDVAAARAAIEGKFAPLLREEPRFAKMVSYVGNKKLPLLRLYRYKEAFSLTFVEDFIKRFGLTKDDYLFDPFCGMGTTLFTGMLQQTPSIGIDKLPVAAFIAGTLPLFVSANPRELQDAFEFVKGKAADSKPADVAADVKIMKIAFPTEMLTELRRWKSAIDALPYPMRDMLLLLFFSILEPCSYTAKDGQFLRLKKDKRLGDPGELLAMKVQEAMRDIELMGAYWDLERAAPPFVQVADARDLSGVAFRKPPTAIITSPPYGNRYDYTRTYSLELCFEFVKNFDELKALRYGILRSHIESKTHADDAPPHALVKRIVERLQGKGKELNNPRIPAMLTAYFVDMQKVIAEWARVLAPNGKVAMVVDNVRFHGEPVPVDLILSELAEEVGFKVKEIIVARYKGNSSQQMGKYGRVPVRESVVVWEKRG